MTRTNVLLATITVTLLLAACDESPSDQSRFAPTAPVSGKVDFELELIREVRALATEKGVGPLAQRPRIRPALVALGQVLAFDPLLSGTRDISCMTCHVPGFGTGDGKSLSIGQGGTGLGPTRSHPQGVFIPRNAPPLFNLADMRRLFWDGRVEIDGQGQLRTPAGAHITDEMKKVFEFGAISALGMFPVTNRFEMRGFSGNELAAIPDANFTAIWQGLMARLGAVGEYRGMFLSAYPGTRFEDMTFAHASNAIAAFFIDQLSSAKSPWDRFLAGNDRALSLKQLEGAKTFLGLRCVLCHNGATFSDQEFHNVAVAQVGPGQGNGFEQRDDFGRMNVSGSATDIYRFRTTPLRNVELTGPYGHDGSILDLREFIEHYSESHLKLLAFDDSKLEPLLRGTTVPNANDILLTRDPILEGVVLPSDFVDRLMDFMGALTDASARNLNHVIPLRVPSGLPVIR
jgi:cytochrome c peroxidase